MSDSRTLIQKIAEHTVQLQLEDISPEAVQMAKWVLFDSIGTALGGSQRELGQKALRYSQAVMRGDEATLIRDGSRVSVEGAAFANAVMTKILGMDDSHRSAGHIASQVIPAVLAVSEAYHTPGRDMLAAIVAAYDFAVPMGLQVRYWQRARGLDLKGTVGSMASALAAARCAGLSVEQTANALALAADLASGTEQYVHEGGPCDTKDLIAGFGARHGVFAMSLAKHGFHGPAGALDGEYGFFRAFGDGGDPAIFDQLGKEFAIVTTGFKPHGGCRHTHQAVDAVQQMLAEAPIDPAAIERVRLATYRYATQPLFRVDPNPPSAQVAGLSIRVGTSVALSRGSSLPDDLTHWDDPDVRRLRQIIEVEVDPELEEKYPSMNGCHLEVVLKSGETRRSYVPYMKGEPEFRMNAPELMEKFYALTRRLYSREHVEAIYAQCDQLEMLTGPEAILTMTADQVPAL
ncbi:MAG: MmgE/PrpD family protein [Chloroflexi bacterium]|nr:MmgE/PrpD family protein [Chloroflexota bacterium]